MNASRERLQAEIRRLDREIEEQRLRIPPHSASPSAIQELEELEDRRESLRVELKRLDPAPSDADPGT